MSPRTRLPYEEGKTFCPDCENWIPTAAFVPHRETEHPPQTIAVSAAGGIKSEERHGYQDEEPT
jgi:hypothetical protein